jgi:hypothetical protein
MKRIAQFDHFILICSTLLFNISCGAQKNIVEESFSSASSMVQVQDLTPIERSVATRICYAYQSKSTSFKTQAYMTGSFVFSVTSKDCTGKESSSNITSTLGTSNDEKRSLIFNSNSTFPFLKTVQSSQSGFLSQLCLKIQNNLPIKNTLVKNDTTIQVSFTSKDIDSYTLQYFSTQNNVVKIQSSETFKVRTQFNITTNQILGMDEFYTKMQVCASDTSKNSQVSQAFLNFIPK